MNKKSLGQSLVKYRNNIGYSIDEVCKLADISNSDLISFENGELLPSTEQVKILSEIYGKSMRELLEYQGNNEPISINFASGLISFVSGLIAFILFVNSYDSFYIGYSIFSLEFSMELIAYLTVLVVSLLYPFITTLYIFGFIPDEYKYHRISIYILSYLIPIVFILAVSLEDISSSLIFLVFVINTISLIFHSIRRKVISNEREHQFSLLHYRKSISSVTLMLNLVVVTLIFFTFQFFSSNVLIFLFILLNIAIALIFPFLKREFFENRFKSSVYNMSAFLSFVIFRFFAIVFSNDSFGIVALIVMFVLLIPVILGNCDKIAANITGRKGKVYPVYNWFRNFFLDKTTVELAVLLCFLMYGLYLYIAVNPRGFPYTPLEMITEEFAEGRYINMYTIIYFIVVLSIIEWCIGIFMIKRYTKAFCYRIIMYVFVIQAVHTLVSDFEIISTFGNFIIVSTNLFIVGLLVYLIRYEDEYQDENHRIDVGVNIVVINTFIYTFFLIGSIVNFSFSKNVISLIESLFYQLPLVFLIVYVIASYLLILKKVRDSRYINVLLIIPAVFFTTYGITSISVFNNIEFHYELLILMFLLFVPFIVYNAKAIFNAFSR